jgi:cytolysin (calcineurin-like family phosphatase)
MFVGNAKATAEATNNAQRDNITALANSLSSSQFAGVVINGDLTAYGHDDELDGYIGLWDNKFAYNIYPGLGNHDYKNNVNNCTENNCATRMYRYGRDTFQTLNALRFDYTEGDQYYKFPSLRKEFNGSLAYSWEIGPIHLVQLNYSPIYVTDWNGWDFSKARRDYYNIQKSIDWLKADLKDAVSRGKRIILNMHNWDDGDSDNGKTASTDPDFLQILSTYPVDAIFAGHIHSSCGWINPVSTGQKLQGPPVFRSGASLYKTFLMARFQSGKLTVQAVDGSKSPVQATVIYTSP